MKPVLTSPHPILLPFLRAVFRPLLWTRNAFGYCRSLGFANPDLAREGLGKMNERWKRKTAVVLSSPDNQHIPRVPDAGVVENGLITMHNGIRVGARSYYGDGYLNLLSQNKGVHEPQEERAFADVLKLIRPGAAMLELGAYWGFYSLWFAQEVPSARCFLVEPDYACMQSGVGNFRRRGVQGSFRQAYVGAYAGLANDGTDIINVDSYCAKQGLDHLEILHADIQGAEVAMLAGAATMLSNRRIDYVFISTHSNDLHQGCIDALNAQGYRILASANIDDTYSGDGLIVARGPHVDGPDKLEISLRSRHTAAS